LRHLASGLGPPSSESEDESNWFPNFLSPEAVASMGQFGFKLTPFTASLAAWKVSSRLPCLRSKQQTEFLSPV